MNELIIILISVIASMSANVAVNNYLFKYHKIGTDEYKKALKYPKTAAHRYEDITKRLSELERAIKHLSFDSNLQNSGDSISEVELETIRREIAALQRSIQTNGASQISNQNEQQKVIHTLNSIAERISKIEAAQNSMTSNEEILAYIRGVEESNKQAIRILSDKIERLSDKPSASPVQNTAFPTELPNPSAKAPVKSERSTKAYTPHQVVEPNQDYIKKLIRCASELTGNIYSLHYELGKFTQGLRDILHNSDFDDPEEIMGQVHELIGKYIYGSDTKVSAEDWKKMEEFLLISGYEALPVSEGDSIVPYRSYFERPIPVSGGTPNTIKHIQLKPYVLSYADSGEIETLHLCGKCTYYK